MSQNQSLLHYEQGKMCYQGKKFQDAIFQFSEALRLQPATPTAEARCHNARGVVYFYLGEFKKVIKDCTSAIGLDSNNANYYNCRGNAYFSLGKFGKAADDFSKAIELSPEASHGRYFNNRGSAYRRLKMFKEAIEDYTAAIAVDPKNGNYYNNRGNTYFDMGEFQLAIDDFQTALGLEPYSPKTKITLQQAHEALAQEKRMKNETEFTGIYSHLKTKGKETYRKDREKTNIYVSPAGVVVIYEHGWNKRRAQNSYGWSEDMKIDLIDDSSVKLSLDKAGNDYVIVTPCDATAVEEELIGRITTKFASYSTACLVAQHEGVVNEYTGIVRAIKQQTEQMNLLQGIHNEAKAQMEAYAADKKFDLAEKSKEQFVRMEEAINQKKQNIAGERERAESVRVRAEQESGPVLDMVLIMQNRVRELYHTRVKNVRGKYNVDDLLLEDQLKKMDALVLRARGLGMVVAQPVDQVERAMDNLSEYVDNDEDEYAELEGSEVAVANAGVEIKREDEDSDVSDWDDLDDEELPDAFRPSGAEVFMTIESANGMVTITPSESGTGLIESAATGKTMSDHEVLLMRKMSLMDISSANKEALADMDDLKRKAQMVDAAEREKEEAVIKYEETSRNFLALQTEMELLRREMNSAEETRDDKASTEEQTAAATAQVEEMRRKMAELEDKAKKAEIAANEKEIVMQNLQETEARLEKMKGESAALKDALAAKQKELEASKAAVNASQSQTAAEQDELRAEMQAQQDQFDQLRADLESRNKELGSAAQDALEKTRRLQQLEEQESRMAATIESLEAQTEAEKEKAKQVKEEFEQKLQSLQDTSSSLIQDLEQTEKEKQEMAIKLEEQSMNINEMRRHLQEMQEQMQKANEDKKKQLEELARAKEEAAGASTQIAKLKEQQKAEELKRRELHNLIQEIKGNIRVYVRIRPELRAKKGAKIFEQVLGSDDRGLKVVSPEETSSTGGKTTNKSWKFEFDRIFWENSQQQDVFSEISQLVQSALDGYKVSIFAYGQTGSGKTFTMEGPEGKVDESNEGMIPRSVAQIFNYAEEMKEKGWSYQCEASFLEIYNTTIRDLIDGDTGKMEIKMVKKGKQTAIEVTNLSRHPVSSAADLKPLFAKSAKNRTAASTDMNARSSRSHSIFQLRIKGSNADQETEGILNLIDLAGSERVDKSGASGDRLTEAKAINSSLTCLGDVISALAQGSKHVPFRNSKLTYLLQDSFGGGSKTLMFINLASEDSHIQETLCSLRFGAKVHDCHVGQAKKAVKSKGKK